MYIELSHRHYGCHTPIKHIEIHCDFNEVYLGDDNINEDLLLANIPEGWLPTKPEHILLMQATDGISTGQRKLKRFRNWAKYFDSYVLDLWETPSKWWKNKENK